MRQKIRITTIISILLLETFSLSTAAIPAPVPAPPPAPGLPTLPVDHGLNPADARNQAAAARATYHSQHNVAALRAAATATPAHPNNHRADTTVDPRTGYPCRDANGGNSYLSSNDGIFNDTAANIGAFTCTRSLTNFANYKCVGPINNGRYGCRALNVVAHTAVIIIDQFGNPVTMYAE